MDHPENITGLADSEGDIPAALEHLTDEELNTDLWDSPACQRCLSYFYPELAEPVHNELQSSATHLPEESVILHSKPADLANGLSEGCWWCSRIFSYIRMYYAVPGSIEDFSQQYPNFQTATRRAKSSSYCLELRLNDDEDYYLLFDLERSDWTRSSHGYLLDEEDEEDDNEDDDDENVHSHQPTATYLPHYMCQLNVTNNSTGSRRSMQYIATQVQSCRETHEGCGRSSDSTWYPRRLLQILTAENGSITALRVVETRDDKTVNGPYATLSYCWGGRLHLRLLTDNYKEYVSNAGILSAKVPQLFLDAASVALNLGASYIWIDALCIIQNDKDDWFRESATMHRVYENGFCNIMAGSAAHSGEPLFRARDTRLIVPCIVRGSDSRKISIYHEGVELTENIHWKNSVGLLPLYQRGWILQERLLATRNIIFTRDNIHVQCNYGITRDVFPRDSTPDVHYRLSTTIGPRTFTSENCFYKWLHIVEAYAYTDLIEQSDTLIAVSGLAEKVKQLRPSRYLHGIWEANLVRGLWWRDVGRQRRLGFNAPSWSWASVHRPSYNTAESDHDQCYEIPKTLATDSEDKLRLQAPMFFISNDTSSSTSGKAGIEEALRQRLGSLLHPSITPTVYLDGSPAEREKCPVPGALLCLPLLYLQRRRRCTGLLLASVTAAWGVYKRVGSFEVTFEDVEESHNPDSSEGSVPEPREEPEGPPSSLLALCTNRPEDTLNHKYDEATKEHTIFLV